MLSQAPRVAVKEHLVVLTAIAPHNWALDLPTALAVLQHAAGFYAAVFHASALDALASRVAVA